MWHRGHALAACRKSKLETRRQDRSIGCARRPLSALSTTAVAEKPNDTRNRMVGRSDMSNIMKVPGSLAGPSVDRGSQRTVASNLGNEYPRDLWLDF
jgi:hypothetical protein